MSVVNAQVMNLASTYDGSTEVQEFFERFDVIASVLGWDDAKQAVNIQLYLVGDAKERYNMLSSSEKKSIKTVKEHLIKECSKDKCYYMNQFFVRKMAAGEKPKAFGLELTKLLKRALPEVDNDVRETILKAQFLNSMPKQIFGLAKFTKTMKCTDLLEAVDESYEELVEGLIMMDHGTSELELEVNKMFSRREVDGPRAKIKFQGNCYSCGKSGHRAVDCWSKKKTGEQGQETRFDEQKRERESKLARSEERYKRMLHSIELNMIETSMLRVNGELSVGGITTDFNFLVDSGASHSFVHPKQLSVEMRRLIE